MKFGECADLWYKRSICGTTFSYQIEKMHAIFHLKRHLNDKEVDEISWLDIEDILIELATRNPNTKKPSSHKLLCDVRNSAYNIFNYAIDLSIIKNNPVRNKLPKTVPPTKRRALTAQERLYVIQTEHRLQLPANIMLFAGLRPNEVMALEYTDFDSNKMRLNINKSVSLIDVNKFGVKKGTKNGKSRMVSIPAILGELIIKNQKKSSTNLITAQCNGELHTPSSWKSAWHSYQKSINYTAYSGNRNYFSPQGIPQIVDKITPYMFRHTYATMLYTSGVDILTASKLMGHADVNTTLNIYTHLEESVNKQNIEKFERYVEENFSDILRI